MILEMLTSIFKEPRGTKADDETSPFASVKLPEPIPGGTITFDQED